jgi:rod shape-determining protein MreD
MKFFVTFLLALLVFLGQKTIYPSLSLSAFTPLMALAILTFKREKALWIGFLIGLIIDLFTANKMGLWALNLSLTTLVIFRFKIHFYRDKPQHIVIFTALFSMTSTVLHFFITFFFDKTFPLSGKWIFTDCIIMPIIDGIYALIWFLIPFWTYDNLKRKLFFFKTKKR